MRGGVSFHETIPPPSMREGELRILETDLAKRLGFDRPRKIRELVTRHKASLEQMGTCPAVGRVGDVLREYKEV